MLDLMPNEENKAVDFQAKLSTDLIRNVAIALVFAIENDQSCNLPSCCCIGESGFYDCACEPTCNLNACEEDRKIKQDEVTLFLAMLFNQMSATLGRNWGCYSCAMGGTMEKQIREVYGNVRRPRTNDKTA